MKAILKFTLACIFCLEILSPVMLGVLNSNEATAQTNIQFNSNVTVTDAQTLESNWKNVDFSYQDENYSDSKSLKIRE